MEEQKRREKQMRLENTFGEEYAILEAVARGALR